MTMFSLRSFNLLATAVVAALLFQSGLIAGESAGPNKGNDKAPLGSPDFYPSPEHPIGWRGDGTGRYMAATPPAVWSRNEKGEKKNIVWETKLPCYSWSSPIIVGDKVITRSEPYDLICLNKNTGKLLWIASHPPLVAVSDEEKNANPGFKEVENTFEQLQQVNKQFVDSGWSKELYKKKYDLQKQLNEQTVKIDKKYTLPPDMYVESWAGYTGATPVSDGKFIYLVSGVGVTACYDLNGTKKWASYEQISKASWGEHGNGWSPAVVGNKLLLPGSAVDTATGAEIFKFTYPKTSDQWATLPFKVGGADFALSFGNVVRLSDGKSVAHPISWMSSVPVLNDNVFYYSGNLWCAWIKVDAQPSGDPKVSAATPTNKEGYQNLGLPVEDEKTKWEPINFIASSPLYDNGLLYLVNVKGRLYVVDVKEDKVVYITKPPFDFKNPASRKTFGMGLGSSVTLAGKYIYIIDSAGCTIVMEPGREYKQVAKNNIDETVPEGWEPGHSMGAHHEQTEASPVFEGSRIYIRGEQYMYCVGEK
jgi:outer membrane protein assembly factor BamB